MDQEIKETRDAGEVGTPAIELAVNNHREEVYQLENRVNLDDDRPLSDGIYLKTRQKHLRIVTWNVRSLYKPGKLDNLIQEAKDINIDVLGVCETRWMEAGYVDKDSHSFIYSGGSKHMNVVGMLLKKNITESLMGYWTVNEKIMLVKIRAKPFNITILQA